MLLNLHLELYGCRVSHTEHLFKGFYFYSIDYNHIEKPHLKDGYLGDYLYSDNLIIQTGILKL